MRLVAQHTRIREHRSPVLELAGARPLGFAVLAFAKLASAAFIHAPELAARCEHEKLESCMRS